MAGNFAVDHNIGHAVAAQSVGSVDAACDFTGSKKAGNGRIVGPKDMHFCIYPDAAHGMMNGRFHADGIVWRRCQRRILPGTGAEGAKKQQ